MKHKLVEAKENREDARDKKGLEEVLKITGSPDSSIGEKAESKQIKDAEELLERHSRIEGVEEGESTPEKND